MAGRKHGLGKRLDRLNVRNVPNVRKAVKWNSPCYGIWDITIILLLLTPLACVLGVGYNVLVLSKVNDVRTAQQLGSLIILPFGAVHFLSEIKVLTLTTSNSLIMAAVLVVTDVIVFYLVKATFQRDEILTKWK
jgi:ABC-2 type transport system permease protein